MAWPPDQGVFFDTQGRCKQKLYLRKKLFCGAVYVSRKTPLKCIGWQLSWGKEKNTSAQEETGKAEELKAEERFS